MEKKDVELLRLRYIDKKSVKAIAKQMKKDQRYISTRISRIKKKYKITEEAVIDRDDLGITSYFFLFFKGDMSKRTQMINFVKSSPIVLQAWGSDEWNGVIYIGARNVNEFTDFRRKFLDTFKDSIQEHKTVTLLRQFKLLRVVMTEDMLSLLSDTNK